MADEKAPAMAIPVAQEAPLHDAPTADYAAHSGHDVAAEAHQITVGAWETQLFSCFDHIVPNCLMVWCCPWVSIAQITSRMGLYPYAKTLIVFLGLFVLAMIFQIIGGSMVSTSIKTEWKADGTYEIKTSGGAAWAAWNYASLLISVFFFVAIWQLRTKVRERFQIPGSPVEDCLLSWFCGCCTVAQMATHIKSYKPGSCEFGPVDTLPPFNAPQ